jgi:hypothetical protein
VYNLSPHRYTKSTPQVLSGKSIKEMPEGSSLILEIASGTLITREGLSILTGISF